MAYITVTDLAYGRLRAPDLDAKAPGASAAEEIDEPGGGKRVRLKDRQNGVA